MGQSGIISLNLHSKIQNENVGIVVIFWIPESLLLGPRMTKVVSVKVIKILKSFRDCSDGFLIYLFFQAVEMIRGPKSIYVVVFVMAVKYTLVNEVNETYKMKFASS